MSANFYWKAPRGHVLASAGTIHIGLSAGGWSFMSQAFEFDGGENVADRDTLEPLKPLVASVRSWQDWKQLLAKGGTITDEYDRKLSIEEFVTVVETEFSPSSTFNGKPALNHTEFLRTDPRWSSDKELTSERKTWVDAQGYSFSARAFS